MSGPTLDFWQGRFEMGRTSWDRGKVSPQLRAWLEAGALRPSRICVPGCGSGWEVAELARLGFDVTGIDFAPAAVDRTRSLLEQQHLPARVEQADVLSWRPGRFFDAIYEQTCLCALHPDHWVAYAGQLHSWLRPGGALWAMFMQALKPAAADGFVEGICRWLANACIASAWRRDSLRLTARSGVVHAMASWWANSSPSPGVERASRRALRPFEDGGAQRGVKREPLGLRFRLE